MIINAFTAFAVAQWLNYLGRLCQTVTAMKCGIDCSGVIIYAKNLGSIITPKSTGKRLAFSEG